MPDIKSVLAAAVLAGATAAVQNPATAATPGDQPIITREVVKAVEPILAHATNNEPWYQSRVTWGAIIAAASPIVGQIVGHQFSDEEQQLAAGIATAIGAAIGGAITLYGRWKAKKPIGQ